MGKARVYRVDVGGTIRMIEANSSGQAEHHIGQVAATRAKESIVSQAAARSIEIADFVKAGGHIETAGEMPPVQIDGAERARRLLGGEAESAPPAAALPLDGQ